MYTTRKTLLQRLQDSDDISWNDFYNLYWPFVFTIGKRLGMMPEDCKDLMQEIMIVLFNGKEILRYDASKGKFRTYFGQIVCHKALKMMRNMSKSSSVSAQTPELTVFLRPADHAPFNYDPFRKIFDEEYSKYLLSLALNELRAHVEPGTYDIFELVVLQGRPPKEVAKHLGINRSTIDIYCSRCRNKLQKIISDIRNENPEFNPELPL